MFGWKPIHTAPQEGNFLICLENGDIRLTRRLRDGFDAGQGYTFSLLDGSRPARWMELPAPPPEIA